MFGAGKKFKGVQFHFHMGSEHTVDGKRHDLEMHTVHLAQDEAGGFGYAAMGLMFSRTEYDSVPDLTVETINKFFDSLKWDE